MTVNIRYFTKSGTIRLFICCSCLLHNFFLSIKLLLLFGDLVLITLYYSFIASREILHLTHSILVTTTTSWVKLTQTIVKSSKMAFVRLMCKAASLERKKLQLEQEKEYAVSLHQGTKPKVTVKQKYRHGWLNFRKNLRKCAKRLVTFPKHSRPYKFFYNLKREGTCENYILKSVIGFFGGFLLTYMFFMFFVFQLNFTFSTATIMCSIFGSVLTIGLAFSYKIR